MKPAPPVTRTLAEGSSVMAENLRHLPSAFGGSGPPLEDFCHVGIVEPSTFDTSRRTGRLYSSDLAELGRASRGLEWGIKLAGVGINRNTSVSYGDIGIPLNLLL